MQGNLFQGIGQIETRVISRRDDFESLFDGFTRLRGIAYVVSSDLLQEFFQKRGYTEIEIVVGEDITEPALRQELRDKPPEILEELATLVENGELRILIPKRSIHTKLYLLDNPKTVRLIQTSANLTDTARKASQVNYAWYIDLPTGHEFIEKVLQDYRQHVKGSTLFMGDLLTLFKERKDTPKRELIEVWIKGEALPSPELDVTKTFQQISANSLLVTGEAEADIVTVKLPDAPAARKELEKLLKPVKPVMAGGVVTVHSSAFVNYVHTTYGVPLMHLDREKSELRLGLKGKVSCLSESLPGAEEVNIGLAHIENYIHTIDLGRSPEPGFAKASMFEALLYLFFAPFVNEYMKKKRQFYGQIDAKGPRFLYIYGPTQNGKTTFLRFVLKLITGQDIEALPRGEFSSRKIKGAATVGTVFPLMFDDVDFSGKAWVEDLFKA
jgi:hypothetical protein